MPKTFKIGDHVRWNSEAGRVSGVIIRKVAANTKFKGYTHHASREAPQYLIKSDKTEHVAIHKGTALRLISTRARKSRGTKKAKKG
jgi:Hypervirulence associated proteins TUDOR domain